MARTEFMAALNQVAAERGIEPAIIIETLKHAMLAAYRKDYGEKIGVQVEINEESGEVKILDEQGQDITPAGFGRIAAQTAKQVIIQKIREAERESIYSDFAKKEGTIATGTVHRIDHKVIIIDFP